MRPLKPFSTYGQPFLTIEATRPSHNSNDADKLQVGEEVWLGLASFHVLDPTGLRMLAWTQAPADEKAVFKAAKELLQASHGRASILSVTQDSEKLAKRKDELEKCCAAAEMTPDLGWAVKAKAGEMDTEVFKELQKESYELVIAQGSALDSPEHEQVLERVVMEFGVSLLLTVEIYQHISEILICTASGEPGKEDVYFGGRIARHTRSITTVLHVFDPERGEAARKRAERHLDKAKDLLNAFNVESVVKMEHGRFLPVLWNELKKKGYQLVVMGVPWKASGRHLEIASNLIKQTKASLLLVPAGRG
ncbi:MAG: hypothetical protein DCC75_13370 [Proteobacteria bacterium]|nr:MAG: hypothetical protein DCC75_13370 [Pseudomonadota bacterium]